MPVTGLNGNWLFNKTKTMENYKEQLFLIPKGSNGLRLHPRAFIEDSMKSCEKITGVLLPLHQIEKLQEDKAELLEALEKAKNEMIQCLKFLQVEGYEYLEFENLEEIKSLIQKHKK